MTKRVLLTGATGFVGSHVFEALDAAGFDVVCGTRNPEAAKEKVPTREWRHIDVEDRGSVERALQGIDAACYLVHGMGQGSDYPQREAKSAEIFVRAAEAAGVRRIVYLGGVQPHGEHSSKHLLSRKITGETLRGGAPSTIEIRAAMIVGAGSASWTMVKDLAARLPAMLLPKWLRNTSYPIAIDDVIWGLVAGLLYPRQESRVFDAPGPERISHRDVLTRVARLLGHTRPMLNVPVLSPRLSSYWIALVTRVDLALAQELVEGVRYSLEPTGDILWSFVDHEPMSLEHAAQLALDAEGAKAFPSRTTTERLRTIGRTLGQSSPWLTAA